MNPTEFNREEAKVRAKRESDRADLKQHADKLIQGIEKLEDSHAKRAIWELFQNAIDLATDKSIVKIRLSDSALTFSHNGVPFETQTLSSLVKQVSSKGANNNEESIGQYGTGFITTHSFGKTIKLSGELLEGNSFIPFEGFEIDRTPLDADGMIDNLEIQQNKVYSLLDGELHTESQVNTSFAYQTISDLEKECAQQALDALPIILPYVMVFNRKLKEVEVIDKEGNTTVYRKGESPKQEGQETQKDIYTTPIIINGVAKQMYSLKSEEGNIEILLPLKSLYETIENDANLSRLFLYYPLIGTESFGFNFVIHSKDFAPKEQRDTIHLNSKNETVKPKEEANKKLMQKASEMVFEFMKKYSTNLVDPINTATIAFNTNSDNTYLKTYFEDLRSLWVNEFVNFPIVETNSGTFTPSNAIFFDEELLLDETFDQAIYAIAKQFWTNMPKQDFARKWTGIISTWECEDLELLTCEELVKKIESVAQLNAIQDTNALKLFYEYLIKQGKSELFNEYNLLPNIKGEFRKMPGLRLSSTIDPILVGIADVLIPDIPKRFIQNNFRFDLELEVYARKELSTDINTKIVELRDELKKKGQLSNDIIKALIDYCNIFPTQNSTNKRAQLMPIISNYFGYSVTTHHLILNEEREIDWRVATRFLLRVFLTHINTQNKQWVKDNLKLLDNVLSIIHDADNFKELVDVMPIFPNQLYVLCKQSNLIIDDNIPPKLKEYHDSIVNKEGGIKSMLVHTDFGKADFGKTDSEKTDFGKYLKNQDVKTPKQVAADIDTVFTEAGEYTLINTHKYQKQILEIIQIISDDAEWGKYFPSINNEKATILMARIQDDATKKDLFSILSLDKQKVQKLGDLARDPNFEKIIELGEKALEKEQQNKADFEFKKKIGVYIEDLIREKIQKELTSLNIDVKERQGGQDILIKWNSDTLYYIEVKSRWSTSSSITMSPLQIETAALNKDKYALCSVEMTSYNSMGILEYEVPNIDEILDQIKFINDIGTRIEPLILTTIARKNKDQVNLTGDYRANVPQTVINNNGIGIKTFIDNLIAKLTPFISE